MDSKFFYSRHCDCFMVVRSIWDNDDFFNNKKNNKGLN